MAWPGLREAKRAEMERRLAEIAYALIRERGFGRVTVEDIVDEARVSRRTFSNYYSCKEEAVAAVILHDAADALDRWQPEPHDGLVDLVRSLVHHQVAAGVLGRLAEVAGLGRDHRQLLPYLHEAQWRLWALAGERVLHADAQADPRRHAELDAVLGAVFGVVSAQLSRGGAGGTAEAARPDRIRELVDHVLTGLERGLGRQG